MELCELFPPTPQPPQPIVIKKKKNKSKIDWVTIAGIVLGTVIYTVIVANMK